MEQIELPGTGERCSRIALGTWAIGGWMWGGTDDQQAVATINAALDRGITTIDTAPAYGLDTPRRSSVGHLPRAAGATV